MRKLLLGLVLSFGFIGVSNAQDINEIARKVLEACGNAKSISYDFYAFERFEGTKRINSEVKIKFQASPLKVFADAEKPTKAVLSYVPSSHPKVHVKKGLKLRLDLYSGMLMKDQHHPLDNAGFATFKNIIEKSIKAKGLSVTSNKLSDFIHLKGSTTYDGKACWVAEIIDNDYKIVNHTVKSDEKDIWYLGRKLAIPEYKVQQMNNIKTDLTPGQVIKVPSSYAKKTTVYIDKATYLPIYQKMEDDEGVYEIYEFKNLKINQKFTDADFSL